MALTVFGALHVCAVADSDFCADEVDGPCAMPAEPPAASVPPVMVKVPL